MKPWYDKALFLVHHRKGHSFTRSRGRVRKKQISLSWSIASVDCLLGSDAGHHGYLFSLHKLRRSPSLHHSHILWSSSKFGFALHTYRYMLTRSADNRLNIGFYRLISDYRLIRNNCIQNSITNKDIPSLLGKNFPHKICI